LEQVSPLKIAWLTVLPIRLNDQGIQKQLPAGEFGTGHIFQAFMGQLTHDEQTQRQAPLRNPVSKYLKGSGCVKKSYDTTFNQPPST
jgi:hypothetical protein